MVGQVRMPNGSRVTRRFRRSDALQAVFDFVDVSKAESQGDDAVVMGSYSLATNHPRRVFEESSAAQQTFEQAGLTGRQEAFFLEIN